MIPNKKEWQKQKKTLKIKDGICKAVKMGDAFATYWQSLDDASGPTTYKLKYQAIVALEKATNTYSQALAQTQNAAALKYFTGLLVDIGQGAKAFKSLAEPVQGVYDTAVKGLKEAEKVKKGSNDSTAWSRWYSEYGRGINLPMKLVEKQVKKVEPYMGGPDAAMKRAIIAFKSRANILNSMLAGGDEAFDATECYGTAIEAMTILKNEFPNKG